MNNSGPFGIDPEEFDRVVREAGEGLRGAFEQIGRFLNTQEPRTRARPETVGEAGEGVWAIYTSDSQGVAHVEQVFKTEIDALRANKHNTDPNRSVRFLPYGIDVGMFGGAAESE